MHENKIEISLARLSLLALVIGVATGYGAVVFRGLIGLIHNIAFLGIWSVNYDANVFTEPSPLGAFIILVPVIGGVIVTFLVKNFAPEARGHGVPEVMNAVYHHGVHTPGKLHGLDPSLLSLAAFTLLGAFTGVAAALYVRSIYWMEDRFEGLIKNEYLRHMLGMAMLGCLFYSLLLTLGHYHVEGVGYSTIQAIMDSKLTVGALLLLLFAAKLFATSITLGSGASGGVFSPALFLGATLGGALGAFYGVWVPSEANAIPTFAMVGMAAMVASSTGAAMTAIVMIFEMTRDYYIVLPMILAVAMAQGIRRYIMQDNIYTLKLSRRGIHIPTTLHSHMFLVKRAGNVMNRLLSVYPDDMGLAEFIAATNAQPQTAGQVVITHGQRITGLVSVSEATRLAGKTDPSELTLDDLSDKNFTIARERDVMFDVIKRMSRKGHKVALVVKDNSGIPRAGDLLGYITNDDIAESVAESLAFRLKQKS